MVKLELTPDEAQLLADVIDAAQFSSTIAQAEETYVAVQMLKSIKARLLSNPVGKDPVEEAPLGKANVVK